MSVIVNRNKLKFSAALKKHEKEFTPGHKMKEDHSRDIPHHKKSEQHSPDVRAHKK